MHEDTFNYMNANRKILDAGKSMGVNNIYIYLFSVQKYVFWFF